MKKIIITLIVVISISLKIINSQIEEINLNEGNFSNYYDSASGINNFKVTKEINCDYLK